MKLIKKIAAIMFAFMMVVSMSTNVSAEGTDKGTITINNAVDKQTYTIYKLLDLKSYVPETTNQIGLYSYKPATEWQSFFETEDAKRFITIDENGYANWVEGANQAEFAQKALAYATTNKIANNGTAPASNNTVTFNDLDLGYYLVDSSVGALCNLNTTNPNMIIQEKNGVPSVEKKIVEYNEDRSENLVDNNSANIGEKIVFKTTININPGAKKYVLHDKMDSHLRYDDIWMIHDNNNKNYVRNTDFVVNTTNLADADCTFELSFTDAFYTNNKDDIDTKKLNKIYVYYQATVKDDALVKQEMKNNTYLTYGENNTKSNEDYTITKTFEIPVYKYTGTDENKQGLAGAKFKLYTDEQCKNEVNVKLDGTDYLVGSTYTNKNVMTSPASTGEFTIKGLKAGTYYLKETEAPKGYNLLAKAIKVVITDDGQVQVKKNGAVTNVKRVEVQNKSGTLLPSTGGAGTTMIYLVGALLVLGSGVVLASKRRSNSK